MKEVVNLYGIKVTTYTEYDKQPAVDPIFGDVSYRVGLFVKGGRVLHGCTYSHSEDEWYYNGKPVPKPQIVRWWYEEDKIYEVWIRAEIILRYVLLILRSELDYLLQGL